MVLAACRPDVRRPDVYRPDVRRAVCGSAASAPASRRAAAAVPARSVVRGESGAVTAEAAVVVPVLLALVLGSTWFVALAATQVRVVDAAREVARVAARGEPEDAAVASGRVVAPAGTRFQVSRDGEQVRVEASVTVDGPGGLFRFLPGVTVASEAVAREEPR